LDVDRSLIEGCSLLIRNLILIEKYRKNALQDLLMFETLKTLPILYNLNLGEFVVDEQGKLTLTHIIVCDASI
jgi:hypothetical protein